MDRRPVRAAYPLRQHLTLLKAIYTMKAIVAMKATRSLCGSGDSKGRESPVHALCQELGRQASVTVNANRGGEFTALFHSWRSPCKPNARGLVEYLPLSTGSCVK
jgi:hypothetical protein